MIEPTIFPASYVTDKDQIPGAIAVLFTKMTLPTVGSRGCTVAVVLKPDADMGGTWVMLRKKPL